MRLFLIVKYRFKQKNGLDSCESEENGRVNLNFFKICDDHNVDLKRISKLHM